MAVASSRGQGLDDRRFDSLVKAVAAGASRRSVLKGMLGLGGAALVGSAALEPGADAARRPTPTPKPVRCPGRQIPQNGQCVCPGDVPQKCGPDCCTGNSVVAPNPGHSECCDNACCFGTCYGEELCCPTNQVAVGGQLMPPIAVLCPGSNVCCYAPNVCVEDACQPPSHCETNEDCGDCETCNTQTGQCNSLCTSQLPVCCVNGFGEYCIPEGETCCSSPSDCTEPCSYCNDVVRYCVDRCDGTDICCEGTNGDDCCTADRCVAGQGCCDEGSVACGGSCCNTAEHYCTAEGQCECKPGTEPCSELPGGCCPTGQCNAAFTCCPDGTSPCGSTCCDRATETCDAAGSCVCQPGLIECSGECIEAQCCGTDISPCVARGFNADCVACSSGTCAWVNTWQKCRTTGTAFDGWCNGGLCLACIPYGSTGCTMDSQCCNGSCLAGRCDTQ